jgi:hypothetical protein
LTINKRSPATPTPRSRTPRKKVKAAESTEEDTDNSRETSHETEGLGMDLEEDCVPLNKEELEHVPISRSPSNFALTRAYEHRSNNAEA